MPISVQAGAKRRGRARRGEEERKGKQEDSYAEGEGGGEEKNEKRRGD